MKNLKHYLLITCLIATVVAGAQTKGTAKVYAYVQAVSGGASPDRSVAPGEDQKSGAENYFIYMTLNSKSRIYPSQLWVNGELYAAKAMKKSSPVMMTTSDGARKTLVPKTAHAVWQLELANAAAAKATSKAKSLSQKNDVVVVYKLGSSFYYITLKEMSRLEDAAMQ